MGIRVGRSGRGQMALAFGGAFGEDGVVEPMGFFGAGLASLNEEGLAARPRSFSNLPRPFQLPQIAANRRFEPRRSLSRPERLSQPPRLICLRQTVFSYDARRLEKILDIHKAHEFFFCVRLVGT